MARRDAVFAASVACGLLAMAAYLRAHDPGEVPAPPRPAQWTRPDLPAVVEAVNREFAEHWRDRQLEPAGPADSLLLCRRISLALTGTIPSLEEIRQLEAIPPTDRVPWWVDHLLADRRHADYMAERFARVLVGVDEGPFIIYRRRRFTYWLSDQLHQNTPYDQWVRQLIAGTGLWTDAPEVNFLTVTAAGKDPPHPDEQRLAGRTARVFLGVRLDCVQCHDDHLGGPWQQTDFHQLAAFYSEARSSLFGIVDAPRAYQTQYLDADHPQNVLPHVPFETSLLGDEDGRRERLANWVTHPENRAFGRAIVNRAWAWLFNKPLVEPIDDIPLSGPYPPGLELLVDDFLQHGCDLKRLWRVLVATDVFQQDSASAIACTTEHEAHWAVFPVTRLRPEQVAGALVQSSQLKTIDANSHILTRLARQGQVQEFVSRFGDMGEDEFSDGAGTIPQRLLMMNGKLVHERIKDDLIANAATRIAVLCDTDTSCIDAAYLTILTRYPTPEEQQYFLERFRSSSLAQTDKLQDLCWVLLNSSEFAWNH